MAIVCLSDSFAVLRVCYSGSCVTVVCYSSCEMLRVCRMPCQLDVSESKTPTRFIEYSTKIKSHSSSKEVPKDGFTGSDRRRQL